MYARTRGICTDGDSGQLRRARFRRRKEDQFHQRVLPFLFDVLPLSFCAKIMSELFRYAAAEVDTSAKDLPALKADFIVDEVPDGVVLIDVGCGGGKMLRTIR